MILRNITKHLQDQNWFAVMLDFIIVVAGILIAFQITNWSEKRQGLDELDSAESALQLDLQNNYYFAKERVTLSACRIENLRTLGEQLLQTDKNWEGLVFSNTDLSNRAFVPVLRSPSRIWGSRVWHSELARGTFNLMDEDRRYQFDVVFKQSANVEQLEDEIQALQARLKVLGQNINLSESDRLRYFDIVAELDEKSFFMEQIAGQIVTQIEEIGLVVDERDIPQLRETLEQSLKNRLAIYGPCVKPFTLPFLKEQDSEVNQ